LPRKFKKVNNKQRKKGEEEFSQELTRGAKKRWLRSRGSKFVREGIVAREEIRQESRRIEGA